MITHTPLVASNLYLPLCNIPEMSVLFPCEHKLSTLPVQTAICINVQVQFVYTNPNPQGIFVSTPRPQFINVACREEPGDEINITACLHVHILLYSCKRQVHRFGRCYTMSAWQMHTICM